jgi:hypothetical protein
MVVSRLRQLDLVGMAEVSVVNETTGMEARALRVFPDGTFDGFVELAKGRNRLRFAAQDVDDSVHGVERWVTYEPPSGPNGPAAVSAGPAGSEGADGPSEDERVEELRRRTAELEAWADLERSREQQRKDLKLRVEEKGAQSER